MSAYSARAQPFIDALAAAAFTDPIVRDWLVAGTAFAQLYTGSTSLHDEQARRRKPMKQPFYCNYWCGRDRNCTCRVAGAKGLETDMMLFLKAPSGERLGISIEVKAPGDRLSVGQAACYPLRAACWQEGRNGYSAIVPHNHWMTLLVCPDADTLHADANLFDKVAGYTDARAVIESWPS